MVYVTFSFLKKLINFRIQIKFSLVFPADRWLLLIDIFREWSWDLCVSLSSRSAPIEESEQSSRIRGLLGCFGSNEKILKISENKGLCHHVKDQFL